MASNKDLHVKLDKVLDCVSRLDENVKNMGKDVEFLVTSDREQQKKIDKHDQTLYGTSGKNGVVGNTKLLMRAFYGAQAIAVTVGGLITMFREQIGQFFQGKH